MFGVGDPFIKPPVGIRPGQLLSAGGTVRAQAVKIGGFLSYFRQPVLDFVGTSARVSFEREGETIDLASAGLESGATLACRTGNTVTLEGVQCGVPVVVCISEMGKPARKVRFVFR